VAWNKLSNCGQLMLISVWIVTNRICSRGFWKRKYWTVDKKKQNIGSGCHEKDSRWWGASNITDTSYTNTDNQCITISSGLVLLSHGFNYPNPNTNYLGLLIRSAIRQQITRILSPETQFLLAAMSKCFMHLPLGKP